MHLITRISVFALFVLLCNHQLPAQVEGLWEVENVSVGQEQLTPVAKWFDLRPDNRLYSGNGGIRNTIGTWQYLPQEKELLFYNDNGIADEMGAFAVRLDGGKLILERNEEGQDVVVHLKRTTEKPLAPWDQIVGLWTVEKTTPQNDGLQEILIRWDRVFVLADAESRKRGIWHIHGHRPLLRLVSDEGDDADQTWVFEFTGPDRMVWRSEKGDRSIYWKKRN